MGLQRIADGGAWLIRLLQHAGVHLIQHVLRCRGPIAYGGMLLLILCAGGLGLLGIYALHTSPAFLPEPRSVAFLSETHIESIEGVTLDSTFFLRLPEFFTPSAETHWWHQ